jgi:CRISPR/Cas system-associated endonuclease Cas1
MASMTPGRSSAGITVTQAPNPLPLVYDLLEPLRPSVDCKVLEFALAQTFTPSDFTINRLGGCRINPQMARALVREMDLPVAVTVATFWGRLLA